MGFQKLNTDALKKNIDGRDGGGDKTCLSEHVKRKLEIIEH